MFAGPECLGVACWFKLQQQMCRQVFDFQGTGVFENRVPVAGADNWLLTADLKPGAQEHRGMNTNAFHNLCLFAVVIYQTCMQCHGTLTEQSGLHDRPAGS